MKKFSGQGENISHHLSENVHPGSSRWNFDSTSIFLFICAFFFVCSAFFGGRVSRGSMLPPPLLASHCQQKTRRRGIAGKLLFLIYIKTALLPTGSEFSPWWQMSTNHSYHCSLLDRFLNGFHGGRLLSGASA